MHKSRLAGFIIDCQRDAATLPDAARFWSEALGMPTSPEDAGSGYIRLIDHHDRLHVEVQAVDHPSRVHIDIETDDIEAEVKRLEGLGAARVTSFERWVVMQAPTGQRFCVVRPQSTNFEQDANVWR